MQLHGPKRIYTRDSLEAWFEKLEQEWDAFFPGDHLAAGRALYRNGAIRGVELTHKDAIVHCRIEKKDEYSVIEWDETGLVVRSSCPDRTLANTIAIAGLHEIEELVADELPAVPTESGRVEALPTAAPVAPASTADAAAAMPPVGGQANDATSGPIQVAAVEPAVPAPAPVRPPQGGNGNGHGNGHAGQAAASAPAGEKAPETSRSTRELCLRFRVTLKGLICEPWWMDGGRAAVQALHATPKGGDPADGNGDGNGHGPPPTAAERMKLISLTALAKKSHFHFQAEIGAYLLETVSEIPYFLKNVLPTWARSFAIERETGVERLESGVQQVRVEGRARRRGGNGIDLEWVFRSGEQMIEPDQARALAAAGGGPVILPGVGMVMLAPESVERLRQWRDATSVFADGDKPAYLLFSLFNDQRFDLTLSPELDAWRESVLQPRELDGAVPELLRPYQRRGVEWLAHLCEHGCHGLLADEMGLGKTLQVATLMHVRPLAGRSHVVVCPASVVPVWLDELERYFPASRVHVLRHGQDFSTHREPAIWLASYAQLRNHRTMLGDFEFGYAVLDEGQFIKNPDAKVTNTCFEIRAAHRIVLTGTPLENRQLDLWSILHFLLPGLLGTRTSFENALLRDREGTVGLLRQQLAPFILRRTKAQVAQELPPKVEMDLFCPLTTLQRQEYARVCREGLERLGDDIGRAMKEKAFGFLSLLTRLRQICCDPDLLPWLNAPTQDSGKLALLIERLGEIISSGHKVVIFSQFVMFLKRVHEVLDQHFPGIPRFELTGATIDRQKPVQGFQSIDQPAFMLVSLKAAGTGITLHAADYVFLLDPWWNPAVEEQAIDRVHRIGQTRTVFVYRLITQGTIEERIQHLKEEKRQLFRQIIDGVAGDLDLSDHFASLRSLIELATELPEPDASEAANAAT